MVLNILKNLIKTIRYPKLNTVTPGVKGSAILAGENCVLLNSIQEYFEVEVWLLLNFFMCLHNQLISIHCVVTY